ncbi:hypothetical protein GQX74_012526 [Glossina fuscipes]|nr:hypothetical protein GQX74_012526 [Glossina fuscipes]
MTLHDSWHSKVDGCIAFKTHITEAVRHEIVDIAGDEGSQNSFNEPVLNDIKAVVTGHKSRNKSTKHHLANSMTDDDGSKQTGTLVPSRKDSSVDLQGPEQLNVKDSNTVTKFNIFHRRRMKSKMHDSDNKKKNCKIVDEKGKVVEEVVMNKEQVQIEACPSKKHVKKDKIESAIYARTGIEHFPQDIGLGEEREQFAVVSLPACTKSFTNTFLKNEIPKIHDNDDHKHIVEETKPKRKWILSDRFKKTRTLRKEIKQEALVESSQSTPEPQKSMPTTTSVVTLHHNASFQNANASSNCAIRRSTLSFSHIANISTKEPEKQKFVHYSKLETLFKRCDEMLENANRVKFEAELNEIIKKQGYEKSFRKEIIANSEDQAENNLKATPSDDKTITPKEEKPPEILSSNDSNVKQQTDTYQTLDQTLTSALTDSKNKQILAITETMAPPKSVASAINSEERSPKDLPSSASNRAVTQTKIAMRKKRRNTSSVNTAKDVPNNKQSKNKTKKPINKDKQKKISEDSVTINKRVAKAAPPVNVKNTAIRKEIKQIAREKSDALKSFEFFKSFPRRHQVNASSPIGQSKGNKLLQPNITSGYSSITYSNTSGYSSSPAKPKMGKSPHPSANALYSSSSTKSKDVTKAMYTPPMKARKALRPSVSTTYSSLKMKSRNVKKHRISKAFTERAHEIIAPPSKSKTSFYKSEAFRANAIINFIIGASVSQVLYGKSYSLGKRAPKKLGYKE